MFDPVIRKYQLRDALIYWFLIPAAVIFSGRGVDSFFDFPRFPLPSSLIFIAAILLVAGLSLIWLSMRDLSKAGGTPNPLRPPKKIVTSGSYSLCRHPMFLGYDCCALSVILFLRSPGMVFVSFPIFLFFEMRFLRREEKILLLKFKQSYAEYIQKTPFLLPFPFRKQFCRRQDQAK